MENNDKGKDVGIEKMEFWNWMGCLPASIAIAIIIWTLDGFPGLVR